MADSLDRADDSKTDSVASAANAPKQNGEVCRTCNGGGTVEDVTDHPRFGPQVLRVDCPDCNGDGYYWDSSQGSRISGASTESVDGGSKGNGNISLLVCTQSSTIRSIQYEAETSALIVAFKSGFSYQYDGVSKEAWDKFTSAESKGSHFAREIKTRYTGRKL